MDLLTSRIGFVIQRFFKVGQLLLVLQSQIADLELKTSEAANSFLAGSYSSRFNTRLAMSSQRSTSSQAITPGIPVSR